MVSAQTLSRLNEMLCYNQCLEKNGLYNLNAGTQALKTIMSQLQVFQMLATRDDPQAESLINDFYDTNMDMLKVAYSPYSWTN